MRFDWFRLLRPSLSRRLALLSLCAAVGLLVPALASAQVCVDFGGFPTHIGFRPGPNDANPPRANCLNAFWCYEPVLEFSHYEAVGGCDPRSGPCGVRAVVSAQFPGNSNNDTSGNSISWVNLEWLNPASQAVGTCGFAGAPLTADRGEPWIQISFQCGQVPQGAGTYTLIARTCRGSTFCPRPVKSLPVVLDQPALEAALCQTPPPEKCDDCRVCPVGGASVATGPPEVAPAGLGPVALRYKGWGAGHPGFPGSEAWNVPLGRYWSHGFAERLVEDPDESRVWLITRFAAFHEFRDLAGGVYQTTSPSSEYRELRRTPGGWELHDLDGTVQFFGAEGEWLRTADANGNALEASYSAAGLASVSFPDGRRADLGYHPDGKLASVTEVGAGGAASRTWSYTWAGPDLVRIDRPDGTAWSFVYDDPRHEGAMTRQILVGTGGGERVERAWAYGERGNVVQTWKGAASAGSPEAVDTYTFVFDNPFLPAVTRVTDPLGQVTTYEIGRDPGGTKPRITRISGDCPSCGLGPDSRMAYDDPANPLRVTRETDSRGTVTLFEYDENGRMTSRTEAAGTPLERTTTWEYAGPFPGLVTAIGQPSTSGSGVRRTETAYDARGNPTERTLEGVESSSPFRLTTATAYNAAGRPTAIDPPGFGARDRTSFTYDPARGDQLPSARTDPLVGARAFGYDPFNRRTGVTDVNGVATETAYDALNRVTSVVQKGATAAGDLVTTNIYNELGDLQRTVLPEGNVIEYGYDAAGRLISIERKPDASTPGERTVYTLDAVGNRVREELQRWTGAGWVTESFTGFEYSTRCHLDKIHHADGSVTEYAYDCEGNLERVWDANHPSAGRTLPPTQLYTYDALDRLTAVTQPWTGAGGGDAVTAYAYDVQDHLVRVTDANGTVTSTVYSDRDLLTEEVSEVSGPTTFRYNEHGELVEETDARGVTVRRQLDALDRVRFADYPGEALDITYRWDEAAVPFGKGRLTAIERAGAPVAYRYDRFGRMTQDGALTFGYDRNGNRVTVGYPGGVTARYDYDFADRQAALTLDGAGAASGPVVTSAEYLPSGPLSRLDLGNGLTEVRGFDARYFPERITVGEVFDWSYTTDAVGNITAIADGRDPAGSRSYGYQDVHYFLTRGDGPWGALSWSYDKIGNRLSETRDGSTAAYSYFPNAAAANSPKLAAVTGTGGETSRYFYDAIGDLTAVAGETAKTRYSYDAARRLSRIARDAPDEPPAVSDIRYDGRSFLESATLRRFASEEAAEPGVETTATYSSDGLLHHRGNLELPDPSAPRETPVVADDVALLYFAGRPVAQVALGAAEAVTYLTTDHLSTPALATDGAGAEVWSGGFEPFGADWSGADEAGVFLRFPGQWVGGGWGEVGEQELYYNVHRWYKSGTGRYERVDPKWDPFRHSETNSYAYVGMNPLNFSDPLGLQRLRVCCNEWDKRHMRRILDQVADLQGYVAFDREDPGPLGINPWGRTDCDRFGSGGGIPTTEYFKFSPGNCVNACLRVHEQFHRSNCRSRSLAQVLRSNDNLDEGIAYAREAGCLQDAIDNGSVEVDVDPLGPDNRVVSNQ